MLSAGTGVTNLISEPTDSDDMRWAIETASAMWSKGDYPEALRWLRRAAETASEEGQDLRAVQLAKLAAELRSTLSVPPTDPPPAEPATRTEESERPTLAYAEAGMSAPSDVKTAPMPQMSMPPEHAPTDPDFGMHAPATTERRTLPPPSREAAAEVSDAGPPTPPSTRIAPPPVRPPSRAGLTPPPPLVGSAARRSVPPPHPRSGSTTPAANVVQHQALRVAVSVSRDRPGVLTAKILSPGEKPAPGSKEALFIALEPGIELNT